MAVSRKKVVVRRFLPGLVRGYLPAAGFVRRESGTGDGILELLDLSGRLQEIALADVKTVSFVREFHLNDNANPERLPRKTFLARPRTEGLWIRLVLRDEELLEGLAPLDLGLADSLAEDLGIQFIPPDVRGNAQRLYVPRLAMASLQVVAVVTTPSRRKALENLPSREMPLEVQPELFAEAETSGTQ